MLRRPSSTVYRTKPSAPAQRATWWTEGRLFTGGMCVVIVTAYGDSVFMLLCQPTPWNMLCSLLAPFVVTAGFIAFGLIVSRRSA